MAVSRRRRMRAPTRRPLRLEAWREATVSQCSGARARICIVTLSRGAASRCLGHRRPHVPCPASLHNHLVAHNMAHALSVISQGAYHTAVCNREFVFDPKLGACFSISVRHSQRRASSAEWGARASDVVLMRLLSGRVVRSRLRIVPAPVHEMGALSQDCAGGWPDVKQSVRIMGLATSPWSVASTEVPRSLEGPAETVRIMSMWVCSAKGSGVRIGGANRSCSKNISMI